jgi:hypothetical protein
MSENPQRLEVSQWLRGAFTKEELEYLNSQPAFEDALLGRKGTDIDLDAIAVLGNRLLLARKENEDKKSAW